MEKQIMYDPVPKFEQGKQAVIQLDPVDMGDYVLVKNKVIDLTVEKEKPIEQPVSTEPVVMRGIEKSVLAELKEARAELASIKAELAEVKQTPTLKTELIASKDPIIRKPILKG